MSSRMQSRQFVSWSIHRVVFFPFLFEVFTFVLFSFYCCCSYYYYYCCCCCCCSFFHSFIFTAEFTGDHGWWSSDSKSPRQITSEFSLNSTLPGSTLSHSFLWQLILAISLQIYLYSAQILYGHHLAPQFSSLTGKIFDSLLFSHLIFISLCSRALTVAISQISLPTAIHPVRTKSICISSSSTAPVKWENHLHKDLYFFTLCLISGCSFGRVSKCRPSTST